MYVVHPTRWLRTIIALSRPFFRLVCPKYVLISTLYSSTFSKKFYHKIHYVYTIAELERQFPHNHFSIPDSIEQ